MTLPKRWSLTDPTSMVLWWGLMLGQCGLLEWNVAEMVCIGMVQNELALTIHDNAL